MLTDAQDSRRCLRFQLRCRGESTSRCRNVDRLPFRHTAHDGAFQTELPYALGSTNPQIDYCSSTVPPVIAFHI
jgi:hypothetical protein